jgi:predicted urease superfamily metal-dependent hydrolase
MRSALRKAHEEMSKGLDALTGAIREGLVDIVGVGD